MRFARKLQARTASKGEFYHGQTLGTYLGGIIQNFNANRQGVHSTGAWAEIYYFWTPCLHSHFGYGTDDPLDSDLTAGMASRNQFYFGNILWDVTKFIDVGFEVSRWETAYMAPLQDNHAMVYDRQGWQNVQPGQRGIAHHHGNEGAGQITTKRPKFSSNGRQFRHSGPRSSTELGGKMVGPGQTRQRPARLTA